VTDPNNKMTPGGLIADAIAGGVTTVGARRRARKPVVALLERVPLFAGLSRRHVRRLATLVEPVRYRDRRVIVEAGMPGSTFFVIAEGAAKVYRSTVPTGRPIARLGPGAFFGEMALLDGGRRSATVVADGPVVALRLARPAFKRLVSREPAVALTIMAELASRLRRGTASE
jgi:CRP-like cAMP-binding protein